MNRLPPKRRSLESVLLARSQHAIACGAMHPIRTVEEIVPEDGVEFIVRRVSSLARKEQLKQQIDQTPSALDPFLPHEPELFVADLSDTHFALLNKFNVIERHLLIVTRAFVAQEMLLDAVDFEALASCMVEIDGLAFYNGGTVAGASQPHKHLQLVPLPLGRIGPPLPIEALFGPVTGYDGILRVPGLPFRHALVWLDHAAFDDVDAAARQLHARYGALLEAAGLTANGALGDMRQAGPYNLLATRRWMLVVPRSSERCDSIPVNALGFAGSLFVRDAAQLALLKRIGPMALLRATAVAPL